MQTIPATSANGERARQRYANLRAGGGGDMQNYGRGRRGYANVAGAARAGGGQRAAPGTRTGTGTGPGPDRDRRAAGPHRGRARSAAAPGTRGRAGGELPKKKSRCPGACPGLGRGDSHGSTGARPRSGVTGTGEGVRGRAVVAAHPQAESVCPDGAPFRGVAAPSIQPAAPSGRTGRGSGAGPGRCRCGRAGAPRAALGTAEPRPPPRRLGMAGYKKPVVCAALGAVIFTRVCAGRNARV